jgi:hypothetical protein
MALDLSIPTTAPMVLVVEDPLTRDYLQALWGNPIEIAFVLGGGNDGVHAIVKFCSEAGYPNVFGVMDRDFRPTNRADWMNPAKKFRTFVLPVHEIENYLLDAAALAASRYRNRDLGASAIEAQIEAKAGQLCWWAACRETIAELKRRFRESFISEPTQAVVDEASARAHVCRSPWFANLSNNATRSTEPDVHRLLADSHAIAMGWLGDGTWRQEFAGKEILRHVAGWMCDRTKIERFPARDADFYADLAKEIAAWQVNAGAVPPDLADLLAALKARIAPPAP